MNLGRWRLFAAAGAAITLLTAAGRLDAQGTITGRVTGAGANAPLVDARVIVIGTTATATTGDDGKFTLRNVPAGTAQVQVLRVGYQSKKQSVAVANAGTATLDFELTVAVTQLEEVVTTATGQQRKVELGNAISTLGDVGKITETSQITTASDLLTAKSPGVIVLPPSQLGAAPTVRVRGISSLSLNNAPIWVVDGVRFSSSTTNSGNSISTSYSLLNTLNPEEIEDIEIVKGPSAATLYGTDAANGVIVVTTKKGRAGAAKWSWSAEGRNIDDRNDYQDMYANWGHTLSNPAKAVRCQLALMAPPGTTPTSSSTCISDSVTHYNLLKDPSRTFIHMGHGNLFQGQVSGGTEAVRYFAGASMDNNYGPIQMPDSDRARFATLNVPVRDEWLHPQAQQLQSYRANLSATISPKLDLTASAGFTKADNRIEPDGSAFIALYYTGMQNYGFKGPGLDKITTDVNGTPLYDYLQYNPGDIMQYTNEQDIQRTLGSLQATWRPITWMQNEATVGVDLANIDLFSLCRVGECPPQSATARTGVVADSKSNNRNFSAKASSTSSWNARTWLNLKTTAGGDYTNLEADSLRTSGLGLPPGASSVAAASSKNVTVQLQPTAAKTLGVYVQEQGAVRDRLFLTVAARSDQNSAFGSNFQRVLYPKASVSWLMSDESFFPRYDWMNQFRLRASYGASGVQPGRLSGLVTYTPGSVALDRNSSTTPTVTPSLVASNPGNANLKPERSTELETGFETAVLTNRIHIDYTYYNKKTHDALISVPIAGSAGAPVTSLLQNVGSTQNTGHELQINTQIVDTRSFGWDMTFSGSRNKGIVLDLGIDQATQKPRILGAGGLTQNRAGDPINSQWYRTYTYSDDNKDGVLQVSEVHVDSAFKNFGTGVPSAIISIQNGFDLLNRRLRISSSFDYKGGYSTQDGANNFQCNSPPASCRETQDPTAPLALQARAIAKTYGSTINGVNYKTGAGYFINGQFWRFRELSATAYLPDRINHLLRSPGGSSLVFSARNLHMWTKFTGLDPETNDGLNGSDTQFEFQSAPPPTYFALRLILKY
jgi:TonB-linked SusC/RagA family outer membrane protein